MTCSPAPSAAGARLPARVIVALALMGGSALLLQVLLLRELLTSFFGNELAVSVILVDWLLLVAAGSWLGGHLGPQRPQGTLAGLQVALAVVGPLSVAGSRAAGGRTMFPGQVVSPGSMLWLAALVVGPCCLLLGAQFAVACRLAAQHVSGRAASVVYSLEAVGALAGGLLFHWILADHAGPLGVAMGLSAANAASAAFLSGLSGPMRGAGTSRVTAGATALVLLAACVGLCMPGLRAALDNGSLQMRWRGLKLQESSNSRFGNLAVTREGSQVSFFQDGGLLFTSEDLESCEWSAHLPLLEWGPDTGQPPGRPRVLVIGAGYPAVVHEVLKHPGAQVTVVEWNTALVRLAERWLGNQAAFGPPVRLITGDARAFLRVSSDRFDVVIIATPDPTTAALNRTYTVEFYRAAAQRLEKGGLLCAKLSGHEAFLTAERRMLHASVWRALSEVFPELLVVPGPVVHLLAAREPGTLTRNASVLASRLRSRGVSARFVDPFSLATALEPFAADQYLEAVRQVSVPPNSDLYPVTGANYLRLWMRQYASGGLAVLALAQQAPRHALWLPAVGLTIGLLTWRRGFARLRLGLLVAAVGAATMGLQLIILLGFQAVAGYLYHQLALLSALNMGGLALGAWLGGRWRRDGLPDRIPDMTAASPPMALGKAVLALCLLGTATGPALRNLAGVPEAASMILGLLALVIGLLGGAVFPLAVVALDRYRPSAHTASRLYAWDLLGAAAGALAMGVFLIPAAGLSTAGTTAACMTLTVLLVTLPALVAVRGGP